LGYEEKNMLIPLPKLFSKLDNIFSKPDNIFSKLDNLFSRLENSFFLRITLFCILFLNVLSRGRRIIL